jgi:hypothetical protein
VLFRIYFLCSSCKSIIGCEVSFSDHRRSEKLLGIAGEPDTDTERRGASSRGRSSTVQAFGCPVPSDIIPPAASARKQLHQRKLGGFGAPPQAANGRLPSQMTASCVRHGLQMAECLLRQWPHTAMPSSVLFGKRVDNKQKKIECHSYPLGLLAVEGVWGYGKGSMEWLLGVEKMQGVGIWVSNGRRACLCMRVKHGCLVWKGSRTSRREGIASIIT